MSYWIAGAATVGALTDRKKPLRGALMGAGLGAGGGALMSGGGLGGLMGSGSAAGGGAGGLLGGQGAGATAGSGSAGGTGYGLGQPVVSGSAGNATYAGGQSQGLLGWFGEKLSSFNQTAKPYMDAVSTGQQAAGLISPRQEPLAAQPQQQQISSGPQALAEIAQGQPNNLIEQRRQYAAQRRASRGY